jgi:hypothetical protein
MPELKASTVRRGGITANRWYGTIYSVAVNAASELQIRFSMASKGGGYTDVQVEIPPDDFQTILEMMSLVDRQVAMEAMSAELSRQIKTQPERDEKTIDSARDEIQQLAWAKYLAKPSGDDKHEHLVNSAVKDLILEIKNKKK